MKVRFRFLKFNHSPKMHRTNLMSVDGLKITTIFFQFVWIDLPYFKVNFGH